MRFDIITAFPDALSSYLGSSMMARAQKSRAVQIVTHDLREFTTDKHRTVDQKPYGGGAGMVLTVEPLWNAVQKVKIKNQKGKRARRKILVTAAAGTPFDQRMAEKLSRLDQVILICGHYEGIDERVMKFADEKISIGSYVLTGGELPALVITDAVTRLVPGVLGNPESLDEESFGRMSLRTKQSKLSGIASVAARSRNDNAHEYPHYTRPEVFSPTKRTHWRVPPVLLSGDHAAIAAWREKHAKHPK